MRRFERALRCGILVLCGAIGAGVTAFGQHGAKPPGVPRPTPPKPATPKDPLNPWDKLDPWPKKPDRNRGTGTPAEETAPAPLATDRLAVITLGQRVKGDLAKRGDSGLVRFRAPAATKLEFSLAFSGDVGSSNVALLNPDGTVLEPFARDGRRFTLANHELMRSGVYSIRIVHDGDGALGFVMSTRGEYPKAYETVVEVSKDGARPVVFDGFDGRSITGVAVTPLLPRESVAVRLSLADNFDEKLGSLEGKGLTRDKPQVELPAPIEISDMDIYRCDVWLVEGSSPQKVILRLEFENPPLGTGTVSLTPKR